MNWGVNHHHKIEACMLFSHNRQTAGPPRSSSLHSSDCLSSRTSSSKFRKNGKFPLIFLSTFLNKREISYSRCGFRIGEPTWAEIIVKLLWGLILINFYFHRVSSRWWRTRLTSNGSRSSSRGVVKGERITMRENGLSCRTRISTIHQSTGWLSDSPTRTSRHRYDKNDRKQRLKTWISFIKWQLLKNFFLLSCA